MLRSGMLEMLISYITFFKELNGRLYWNLVKQFYCTPPSGILDILPCILTMGMGGRQKIQYVEVTVGCVS